MTTSVRILLIEDSPSDQEMIKRALDRHRRAEFQVTSHETLREGMKSLVEGEFDIVLLDLSLPDSHGLESLESVMEIAPEVPVVVLSGLQDEQTAVEAVKRGAQNFLTKGKFEADLLARSILYAIQRKRLELNLQRAHDELEERVEERTEQIRQMQEEAGRREEEFAHAARLTMLGELMTGLAHELNQPLMSIVAFTSTAQQLVADKAPYRDLAPPLERILSGATLAGEIIRRLRRMVRRSEPQSEPLNINDVIREAMQFLSRELESRNVRVEFSLAPLLPSVMGDRIQLQQVVLNLVSNALQAIDRAGERTDNRAHRVAIATRLESPSGEVVARVTNTGPVISTEEMEQLFNPFFTTRPEGLGLGLAISKSLVESHGGRIEAQQADDEGMTFLFSLPAKKQREQLTADQDGRSQDTSSIK
ncbi:MAG: ATP-binding protein [Planctomycetota bacterium]|nr:ATP-binding protein [Planctomycetota bacterium]MDA1250504.1 ATP-binding protein [Planctomycetota bacterium]